MSWILTLRVYKKDEPDSMFTFAITKDSSYIFPITNYQSSLKETKIPEQRAGK